ncbi:MAG: cobyrinate a,c-diamide synthase [Actinomycetota bacterium]
MIPRIIVAGTSSGCGKTTVASGLLAALRARGRAVQGFKVGPDFIDPGYHALATGRPGRNLDAFLSGPDLIAPLFAHGAAGAEIAVIEGVMGLFDGVSGRGELASTAHVAKLLRAPVLLVVDAAAMARSVAAIVHGYRDLDRDVPVAGVVLNRVGSDWHEELLREALAPIGLPVVGALRRDDRVTVPERHLGLVPVAERASQARAALDALAALVAERLDLDAVEALAAAAPPLDVEPWSPGEARPARAVVAVAGGPAFGFRYQENLELLRAAGSEVVDVDPLVDEALPAGCGALVLPGGFPETHAEGLSANAALRAQVAAFARAGRPMLAECGGLLYLCAELDGLPMCGVLPATGAMSGRLTLGYREATAATASAVWREGEAVRGHEFHHSAVTPVAGAAPAWRLEARGRSREEGFVAGGVHASYLHTQWAATPAVAERLVEAAE